MNPHRIGPTELQARLTGGVAPLVLDARRSEAFRRQPTGIAGAVPLLLDDPAPQIPDLPRDTPVVAYCLCSGQASSTRVALWLRAAGYKDVSVLEGGLPGWRALGLPLSPIDQAARERVPKWIEPPKPAIDRSHLIAERAFLIGEKLPLRRTMAVLFVDMVDSTHLLLDREPEDALRLVQLFMEVVVNIAVQHCGDVHDFEGDGAMLYFAGAGEAVPAAFNLRAALAARRHSEPDLPRERIALAAGPLMVGYVGAQERRSLTFIGPSINTAARILKLAPPDGIVATQVIVEHARRSDPDLAARFEELPERQHLKGFDAPVAVFIAKGEAHCRERCT